MKKVKINNKDWNIPTSWSEITLKQFLEIRELEKTLTKETYIDFGAKYIEVMTGINKTDIDDLNPEDFYILLNDLVAISRSEIKQINEPIFNYEGKTYILDKDTKNIKFGQWIDLDYITKEKEYWEISHKVAAMFMRQATPKNKLKHLLKKIFRRPFKASDFIISTYSFEGLDDRSDLFYYNLPMDQMYTCSAFFLTLNEVSQKIMSDYFHKDVMIQS